MSRRRATMRPNAIRPLFWAVQFVNFCVVTPWILTLDDSCPCRPPDQCPNDSRILFKNSQVIALRCETEQFIRCCSAVRKPIESAVAHGSPPSTNQRNEIVERGMDTEDSTEKLTLLEEETGISEQVEPVEYSEATLQSTVPSVEESSTEALVPSSDAQFAEDNDKTKVNATGNEDIDRTAKSDVEMLQSVNNSTSADAEREPTLHRRVVTQKEKALPELRPMHVRVLNRGQEMARFEQPGVKKSDELVKRKVEPLVRDDEEQSYVQDLIDQVARFESFRTFPKEPVSFPVRNSKRREEDITAGRTSLLAPGRAISNRDYHLDANLKLPSRPKSVAEKTGDPVERKTSLGVAVTLDEASTRAANENASPTSRLDDDTLVRHLSDPEDEGNIKRVARSHALETDSNDSSNISRGMSQDQKVETSSVRRFKRPPRILPVKSPRSQEHDPSRYANSKERARSLFNKSNETRRKQVSFIISRNESNPKKLNLTNHDFSSMEKIENEGIMMQVDTAHLR